MSGNRGMRPFCCLPLLQIVMLGSGAADYEEAFRQAQAAYPGNVRAHVGFSVPLR